ncbi:hypothetical protein [Paenibacillus sp. GXUN7292]|uniref:hypothetical protein n=1 Tax=Paenibacillus sp. GXUN7292 TaxID=3422499 RepID=UPI003D7D6549
MSAETATTKKYISQETIEQLKMLDIKEFAEAMGEQLHRNGRSWMTYRNGGERTASVAITPDRQVWKDFSQGMYGRDALSFYAYRRWNETELKGERFSIAVHEACAIAGIPVKYEDGTVLEPDRARKVAEASPVSEDLDKKREPEHLNRFYRSLLDLLHLSEKHRVHLTEERCLTPSEIGVRGYRTLVSQQQARFKITQELISLMDEEPEGIPGFFLQETEQGNIWSLAGRNGFLVPFRNEINQIVGLQLRVDDPDFFDVFGPIKVKSFDKTVEVYDLNTNKVIWSGARQVIQDGPLKLPQGTVRITKGSKYLWLSTYADPGRKIIKGARMTPAPYHVAVPSRILCNWDCGDHISNYMNTSVVWLGEGPLKGDIASEYTDQIHLQIASVNAMDQLFQPALDLGAKTVILAPDADAQSKVDTVGNAVVKLIENALRFFEPRGVEVKFAAWNVSQSKGLDDLLNSGYSPHLLRWDEQIGRFKSH